MNGRPEMFSSGSAVTRRLTRRRNAIDRRRLDETVPSASATLTRRLLVRASGSFAAKRPFDVLVSVTSVAQAPPSRRSTTTGTAAAGDTRPEIAARAPCSSEDGAWNAATCRPSGTAAAASAGVAVTPRAAARTAVAPLGPALMFVSIRRDLLGRLFDAGRRFLSRGDTVCS